MGKLADRMRANRRRDFAVPQAPMTEAERRRSRQLIAGLVVFLAVIATAIVVFLVKAGV